MIAAALSALPLLSQAGQGLISTIGQDVSSLFGAGSTGQNVPAAANTGASNSTQSASASSPITVSSVAQSLSSDVMNALTTLQNDLSGGSQTASSYLGQAQHQASQKYQAADSLLNGVTSQLSSLLGGTTATA